MKVPQHQHPTEPSACSGNQHQLFIYEAKRAGMLHERLNQLMMHQSAHVACSTNNSNTMSAPVESADTIKDVQIHKSKFGTETRVETELQSCGPATDVSINIIMDSDSNVSNAIGNSIEYESRGVHGATDETPTPGRSSGSFGSDTADTNHLAGGGKFWRDSQAADSEEDANDDPPGNRASTGAVARAAADAAAAAAAASAGAADDNNDDDENYDGSGDADGENDEEGGFGEGGGRQDAAAKHFKRYLDGENVSSLRGPCLEEEAKESLKKLPTGHLEKEGVVIGCVNVFCDVHMKEYIVMLSDDMIQAFLIDPERFRSVAIRTKCEIEVTRRILNRRMGNFRWLKYLVIAIRGPGFSSIDQCDKMMSMLFPPYKWRKPYGRPAAVSMFLKESTPDNSDLYFNFQRTGPCQRMFGEITLKGPFRKTALRPVEFTPWKMVQKRQQWGLLEPKNSRMESVVAHVFPDRGIQVTGAMDPNLVWADAAAKAVLMSKAKDLVRSQMLYRRKMESEPLFTRGVAE